MQWLTGSQLTEVTSFRGSELLLDVSVILPNQFRSCLAVQKPVFAPPRSHMAVVRGRKSAQRETEREARKPVSFHCARVSSGAPRRERKSENRGSGCWSLPRSSADPPPYLSFISLSLSLCLDRLVYFHVV